MSLLDLSLLGLLADQPLHGYELKKRLGDLAEGRTAVSFGSLYPALNRLDRNNLVQASDTTPRPHVPMTGSLGAEVAALRDANRDNAPRSRRTRKVYTLTPAGQQRLVELLVEPPADDRTFAMQLAFARHLTDAERLALLRRRRGELVQRLESDPEHDSVRLRDRYRRAAQDRGRLGYQSELDWLDRLIDEELELEATSPDEAIASPEPSPNPIPNSAVGGPRS